MKHIVLVVLMILCGRIGHAQIFNDSMYRYEYRAQAPEQEQPVLVDAYHNTIFHSSRNRPPACEAMIDILEKELGPVNYLTETIDASALQPYPNSLLILKGLPNDQAAINDSAFYWKSPLAMEEVDAITRWTYNGGKLMLFLSHFPNGSGGKPLLEALSVRFRDGYVYHGDHPGQRTDSQCSWFTMTADNELLVREHPVLGNAQEAVESIRLLCGAAIFRNPQDAVLVYPDKAANLSLDADGNEIAYAEQSGQYAALLAFEFGKGKVIVSGDLGLFRNNLLVDPETREKTYITINDPQADNAALLVNLVRWLKK